MIDESASASSGSPTLWIPSRVLVTKSAFEEPHGANVVARCEAAGVEDITVLPGDRLPPLRADDDRAAYALAKRTLAVVPVREAVTGALEVAERAERVDLTRVEMMRSYVESLDAAVDRPC
jgi:hypothetical protein